MHCIQSVLACLLSNLLFTLPFSSQPSFAQPSASAPSAQVTTSTRTIAPPSRSVAVVAVGGEDLRIGLFRFLGIGIDHYQNTNLNLKTPVADVGALQWQTTGPARRFVGQLPAGVPLR
jgi:hypothetical protein